MIKSVFIFFLLIIEVVIAETKQVNLFDDYKKYEVTAQQAKCLDGTQPAFYFYEGSDSDKWVIFFEGGGWCGTSDPTTSLADCYARSQTDFGSSKNYPDKKNYDGDGLLSNEKDKNKYFYNYNKVYIKYCDGTGHQGYNEEPFLYQGNQLWFRGFINTNETINYAMEQLDLKNAKEVVIAGCSAGGLAVYSWVDKIAGRFDQSKVKVYGVADAGIFLDVENVVAQDYTFRKMFQNFMQFSNSNFDVVSPQCAAKYKQEQWRCMFFQYMVEFIQTPIFMSESEYDMVSLPLILGMDCVQNLTLKTCGPSQMQQITLYREQIVQLMQNVLTNYTSWGAWAPACVQHCFCQGDIFVDKSYEVPELSLNTVEESIEAWKIGKENTFIDEVEWPNNKPCSYDSSQQKKFSFFHLD